MRKFFILALGRSGTNFLAALLRQVEGATVHHEPYPYDAKLIWLRHAGSFDDVVEGMLETRFGELLPQADPNGVYGEVNSYLRYEAAWLRKRFDPTLIHLVRDGRNFVRSAYIRDVFTADERDGPILPKQGDPAARRWEKMDRFERLCWYWAHTNRMLAESIERPVQMEQILSDYAVLKTQVLDPIGLELSRESWQAEKDSPKNTSAQYRMKQRLRSIIRPGKQQTFEPIPRWPDWTPEQNEKFAEWCGPTMREMGYEFEG